MTIQNLPSFYDMTFTNKDGRLTSDGYLYLDQQFQALNLGINDLNGTTSTFVQTPILFNDNPFSLSPIPPVGQLVIIGINPPSFTTEQINIIAANISPNPPVPVGTIWFNSTMNKLQFLGSIGVQTITSV
jgi:hypothetical protein